MSSSSSPPLSQETVTLALADLPGWQFDGQALTRKWKFETYEAGVAFAVQVALHAQRADHHPVMVLGYAEVEVRYWSHDAGGITPRDLSSARAVSGMTEAPRLAPA